MATMGNYKCQSCGNDFSARTADRKRGWARFCSKSCKAIKQEKITGQYKNLIKTKKEGVDFIDIEIDISDADFGASDGGCWYSSVDGREV